MTQTPAAKAASHCALGVVLVVCLTAAGYAHHRSAEKARLLADINRIEIPAAGYAIETSSARDPSDDSAWRAYCEGERVTLIEEARAAADRY